MERFHTEAEERVSDSYSMKISDHWAFVHVFKSACGYSPCTRAATPLPPSLGANIGQ